MGWNGMGRQAAWRRSRRSRIPKHSRGNSTQPSREIPKSRGVVQYVRVRRRQQKGFRVFSWSGVLCFIEDSEELRFHYIRIRIKRGTATVLFASLCRFNGLDFSAVTYRRRWCDQRHSIAVLCPSISSWAAPKVDVALRWTLVPKNSPLLCKVIITYTR